MKKKYLNLLVASTVAGVLLLACGNTDSEVEDVNESVEEAQEADDVSVVNESKTEDTDILPDYEYPGPESFYYELYDYVEDFNKDYDEADVSIPCVRILDMDESDNSDIKVYGEFDIYNYNLDGDTLSCVSGGNYPGLIHVAMYDDGTYDVTGFDVVLDGDQFDTSAKEIFGDKYDAFIKMNSDQEDREKVRAQIISNYVFANNLDIKYYQDYGWDKVGLPEENIDSFYSILD
ncbi:hypothetical protein [Pseudobutyrivibrio ruminis]|uniref:hypothetical protein n=1 Tax=Pseudobutyrivibrio ruminis TaxID=46206 RepID=UPI00040F9D3F|nr:hypothetical protein [Pseudobutyrivibrio ruminis]